MKAATSYGKENIVTKDVSYALKMSLLHVSAASLFIQNGRKFITLNSPTWLFYDYELD